jgi:capsular polysaccharide biosynthesis protein
MTSTLPESDAARRGSPRPSSSGFPTTWFVIGVALAVAVATTSYLAYDRYRPVYQSTAAITFDQPKALATATDAGIIQKLSQLRLQYGGLIRTDAITGPVADKLGLRQGQVQAAVLNVQIPNSLLLGIGAQTTSPERSKEIATATAETIVEYTDKVQSDAGVPTDDRVVAHIVIKPQGARQIAPTEKRRLSVAILGGILVFAVVLGVAAVVRRRT